MNQTELSQNADFLSIALEEIEAGHAFMAGEFAEEVSENLEEAGRERQAETLSEGVDVLEDDEERAEELIGAVYAELVKEL